MSCEEDDLSGLNSDTDEGKTNENPDDEEEVEEEDNDEGEDDDEDEEAEAGGDPIESDEDAFENLDQIPLEGDDILVPLSPKDNLNFPEFSETKCCRYLLKNEEEYEEFFSPQKLLDLAYVNSNLEVECIINELRNFTSIIDVFSNDFDDSLKINLLDSFVRNRHEVLSHKLLECINIDFEGTDVPFNQIFPIPSKRTPDFIVNLEPGTKKYLVLEITAVSDVEKASIRKGDESKGYTSKYKKEIDHLLALGYEVTYLVVIFDVFDPLNCEHEGSFPRISELLNKKFDHPKVRTLDFLRKEYCNVTKRINRCLGSYYNVLFGEPYSLKSPSRFEDLSIFGTPEKEYTGSFVSIGISNGLYDRLVSFWPRIEGSLNKFTRSNGYNHKVLLCFDYSKNSFSFIKATRGKGELVNDWFSPIEKNWYTWVIKNLCFSNKSVLVNQPRPDFEFFNYECSNKDQISDDRVRSASFFYNEHPDSFRISEGRPLVDFGEKLKSRQFSLLKSVYEDEDYENKILDCFSRFDANLTDSESFESSMSDLEVKPLAYYKVNEESFTRALDKYKLKLVQSNDSNSKLAVKWVKQPFIYPIYKPTQECFCSYKERPFIIDCLDGVELGGYTSTLIGMCRERGFEWGSKNVNNIASSQDLRKQLGLIQREVTSRLKIEHRLLPSGSPFPKMSILPDHLDLKNRISDLNSKIRKIEGVKESKKLGVIKLSSKPKTLSGNLFKEEMEHFKSKELMSNFKGVGNDHNFEYYDSIFKGFFENLMMPSLCKPEELIYDDHVSDDCKLLKDLKNSYVDVYSKNKRDFAGTNLYSTCCFISRFCHSLLYLSQTSLNSDYVCVDNLGTRNAILLVKGGKKIFPTKRSKLFRLIYPTYKSVCDMHFFPGFGSSFKTFQSEGLDYIVTPWMNLHETVLTDGLTIHSRIAGFSLLTCDPEKNVCQSLKSVIFNVVLALHNRRQTEVMLHNLRYIFMNCMSEVSAVEDMLHEFAGFNYDFFQFWIRNCLINNFKPFAKTLLSLHNDYGEKNIKSGLRVIGLKHPFTGYDIVDLNDLASGVYSTYLMSKAPTTQSLEQVSNMLSVLDSQEEYSCKKGGDYRNCLVTVENEDFASYYNKLFSSDFNFDPKFCVLVGKFFGDYLKSIDSHSSLQQKWDSLLEEPWDEMANTKGLRGGEDREFFGSKGYYVVYKDCLERDEMILEKVKDIVFSDDSEDSKRLNINKLNQSNRDMYKDRELKQVVFHVVDKKQRGGKREIYVMDMDTKMHQQTIEKFTANICKMLPNEMISVPSNKRLSHVHSKVFETVKEASNKFFWVLDCRKWAPKSVIEKFMLFLSGAKDNLPPSFVYHCYNFFNMLREKRVYTRKYVYDIINKNKGVGENIKRHFKFDELRDGYYINMKHSWVMGIFNYFSSMMHVATQMYSSHLIRLLSLRNHDSTTILHMIAHSDDSAGKLITDSPIHLYRSSLFYEVFMHATNHLISKKKSNKGKVYYEFLSILYIGGELLSLLAKFIGIFNFHPSDKGYCVDINDSYSKCIEILLNGATLSQAYIAMKIQSEIVHRFYFNSSPKKLSYDLPTNLMGVPDPHPLMVLILGSDSDSFRIMSRCGEEEKKLLVAISEFLAPIGQPETGFFNTFVSTNSVSKNRKLKEMVDFYEVPDEIKSSWTLKNVSFHNTALNCMQFIGKLNDPSFISSLQDETVVRRISRAFYHRSHRTTQTSIGPLKPREILEAITILKIGCDIDGHVLEESYRVALDSIRDEIGQKVDLKLDYYQKLFRFLYNETHILYRYFDMIDFDKNSVKSFHKTCKPVYMKIQKTIDECPIDFDPSVLVSWIKEPTLRWSLPKFKGLRIAEEFLLRMLTEFGLPIESIDENQLFKICRKIRKKSSSEYYCYSNMPGNIRDVVTYQDFLAFLSHNSFHDKFINGLNIQFGKTLSFPVNVLSRDFELEDVRWTNSFLLLFNALLKSQDFEEELLQLEVLTPPFLYNSERNMLELFNEIQDYWIKRPNFMKYFKPMFIICESLLNRSEFINPEILKGTNYHSFIKRQFLVDNVWLGTGKLFISIESVKLVVVIRNLTISHFIINVDEHIFTKDEIDYLGLCLKQSGLPSVNQCMSSTSIENRNNRCFGIDRNGQYQICRAEDLVACIECVFNVNLDSYLSDPSLGLCKSLKRGRVLWTYDRDNTKVDYVINFYPYEPTESTNLLRSLILDSRRNRSLLMGKVGDASNILLELCYKELDVELNLDFNDILVAPTHTKIYKILQTCRKLRLCEVNFPEIRRGNVPAREGSFLLALINYSKTDKNFDFRWQHVTTPEYLTIKSSQPESFITELMENITQKYYSWYDSDDRAKICKSLMNIYKNLSESDEDKAFLNAACTWGFVGVSGAIDELEGNQSVKNFDAIRFYPKENPFSSHFSRVFLCLIKSVFLTYKEALSGIIPSFKTKKLEWFRIDSRNINYHIMSFIHQIVLRCYDTKVVRLNLFFCGDGVVKEMLVGILRDEELIKIFTKYNKSEYFLSRLPACIGTENDWLMAYNTLMRTYLEFNQVEKDLDFKSMIQRDDSLELPFSRSKHLLSDYGIKVSAAKVYHQGSVSRQILQHLSSPRRLDYEGQSVYMKPEMFDFRQSREVTFNSKYWPKHPLSEEFMDSDDFEDLDMEFQSEEIDLDEVERIFEEGEVEQKYDYEGLKRVKISFRGRLLDVLKMNFKVLLMFGSLSSDHNISKIRQSGDNLIILTDNLNNQIMRSESSDFLIFRSLSEEWLDHTIIHPKYLFYIVVTRRFRNIKFWESYLNCLSLRQEERDSISYSGDHKFLSTQGKVIDPLGSGSSYDWMGVIEDMEREKIKREEEMKREQEIRINSSSEAGPSSRGKAKLSEIIENSVLDDDVKEKLSRIISDDSEGKRFNKRTMEELILIALREDSDKIVGGLRNKLNKMKEIPLNHEEQEMLYQVPLVFGGGRKRGSVRKLSILRDPELIAEIESIQPGLIWLLISGNLSIGQRMMRRWENQMKIYGKLMKDLKNNKKGKLFILNLCRMFLNDANLSKEEDTCKEIWDDLYDRVTFLMIDDEEEEDSDEDLFKDSTGGRMRYNVSGEVNLYATANRK